MTRSSTEFISIGVQFSFKGVFDPVRGICVAARERGAVCVREPTALFSLHYGRFSRFYIFVIADTNSADRVAETFITVHLCNVRPRYCSFHTFDLKLFYAFFVCTYLGRFRYRSCQVVVCLLFPENCDFVVMESRGGCVGRAQPWRWNGTARYRERGAPSLSGAFFAAPECGNAAAGGAAEIATRHPPAPGHNASRRDAQLCFTIRDAMCSTYARTS